MISTDNPYSEIERNTLAAVLALMIPASAEYQVPGADDPSILADIIAQSLSQADHIASELSKVNLQAQSETGKDFAELDTKQQTIIVNSIGQQSPFFMTLSVIAVQCYYIDDRVLKSLQFEAGPPFPGGHQLEQGDWSLLEPVKSMPKRWRDT